MMPFIAASFGCSLKATLVPVEGPLSQVRPIQTIEAKATGLLGNSGGLTWTMPAGAICKGRWSVVENSQIAVAAGSLMSQYGGAYLTGYSVASGGQNHGAGLATCADGRVFQIEFVSSGHGYGIAKDSENNIYRFVF